MTTTTNKNRDKFISGLSMDELVRRVVEACGQTVANGITSFDALSDSNPDQGKYEGLGLPNRMMTYTSGDGTEYTTDLTVEQIQQYLFAISHGLKLDNGMICLHPTADNDADVPSYRVSVRTQEFAGDLSDKWNAYHKLSDKQMAQAVRIVTEAITGQKDKKIHPHTEAILDMLVRASENLQRPSVEFDCSEIEGVSHDGIVRFKYISRGPNKGRINISSEGSYGHNDWYGRIMPDGELYLSYKGRQEGTRAWLNQLLALLNSDIVSMVKEYGTKSGRCCFCRKTLTDPQSVRAGFGATCAKHFGLLDKYRSA
jgi:hypothetical protein